MLDAAFQIFGRFFKLKNSVALLICLSMLPLADLALAQGDYVREISAADSTDNSPVEEQKAKKKKKKKKSKKGRSYASKKKNKHKKKKGKKSKKKRNYDW